MKHTSIDSSHIISVGHDPAHDVLEIKFKGGDVYAYDGVPADIHEDLLGSTSAGSYFHRHINGKFPHRRVSGR